MDISFGCDLFSQTYFTTFKERYPFLFYFKKNAQIEYDYIKLKELIKDKENIIIFSTSPAVRISLGEEFGMNGGSFVEGKMVSLLRKLGADYVLDTNFGADLTIVEEASELIERITKNNAPLPQFTKKCVKPLALAMGI